MKKQIKIFLIIISIIIGSIILDTLQTIIFKNSPAISLRDYLEDNDSWVDRGILVNTYYCTKEEDIVTVSVHNKTSKFTCPIDNNNSELNEVNGVWMKIKKGTLTKTGATIIINDMSSQKHTYGEEYRIDKLENNEWKKLDVVVKGNYGWNSIGYTTGSDHKLELEINWKWLYGELEKGTYRIVKSTTSLNDKNHLFSVEFEIN